MTAVRRRLLPALASGLAFAALATPAAAHHPWENYHWARTSNPFTLRLDDRVNSNWDPYLATTAGDWSQSTVLDTALNRDQEPSKRCPPVAGAVEVCNASYGKNGWLGLAQVWVSGDHITQGTVKLNDTYFGTARYNTPAWRNTVMCQEVGHTLGLGHDNETYDTPNTGSCMDYTSNPAGPLSNEHPGAHDYEQLETTYRHLDSTTTLASGAGAGATGVAGGESRAEWGRGVRHGDDGRPTLFERHLDDGRRLFTFVIWAR